MVKLKYLGEIYKFAKGSSSVDDAAARLEESLVFGEGQASQFFRFQTSFFIGILFAVRFLQSPLGNLHKTSESLGGRRAPESSLGVGRFAHAFGYWFSKLETNTNYASAES